MKASELESLFVIADHLHDLAREAERWERSGSEDGRNLDRLQRLDRESGHLKSLLRVAWNEARQAE